MSTDNHSSESATQKRLPGNACCFCTRQADIVVRFEFTSAEDIFDRTETTNVSPTIGFCFNCGFSFWANFMKAIVSPVEQFLYSHPEDNINENGDDKPT